MERENKLKKLRKLIITLQTLKNMFRKLAYVMLVCSVLSYLGYSVIKPYILAIICITAVCNCFMFTALIGLIDIVSLIVECTYEKTIQASV